MRVDNRTGKGTSGINKFSSKVQSARGEFTECTFINTEGTSKKKSQPTVLSQASEGEK
jgi:hypothetical protein